jgi:voltage-gated potassium channel Kch
MLAHALRAGAARFVVLEQDEHRVQQARESGYLCLQGDATDENALRAAGLGRARALATVLPNDAANVFITLSARALDPRIEIIARGEAPSTEGKLMQAGADKVVLPTHIGAERIAEMILFPETARFLRTSERMLELERTLRGIGLETEVVIVPERGALTGMTIEEIEQHAAGRFMVLQLNPRDGDPITAPGRHQRVRAGDGLVIVCRDGGASRALFEAPAQQRRVGRMTLR